MDRKNDTMYRSLQGGHLGHFKVVIFIDVKNNEKLQFNYWNYTFNYAIYLHKSDEHTPINGDFNRKNDETIP